MSRSKCHHIHDRIRSDRVGYSVVSEQTKSPRNRLLEVAVAGRRIFLLLISLLILVTMVACTSLCSWDWLPFGLGGACRKTLDQETLDRLRLSMEPTVQMKPGETRQLLLGVVECCYVFEPVDACATWSVSPSNGATIHEDTGVLTVDPDTQSGAMFTVAADVEEGRRLVTVQVYVYTTEANPLVGNWREEAQFACETWQEVIPQERIGELQFRADGSFSVTWYPFEIYRDYWGGYRYDLEDGTLDLTIDGGNYVPEDVDGSGYLEFDDQERLVLRDLWLGTPDGGTAAALCGHGFVR